MRFNIPDLKVGAIRPEGRGNILSPINAIYLQSDNCK